MSCPNEQSGLPQGWALSTLGAICSKPQYGWTTSATENNTGVHLLRTTDITSGMIGWETVPFCEAVPDDVDKYRLRSGDIVISRAGSVGFSYLLRDLPRPAVFASYLIRFRPREGIDERYLAAYLLSPRYWSQIAEKAAGIALANVNARKLEGVKLPVAPHNEQRRIVAKIEELFSDLDAGVVALERVRANLKRYRASVLKAAVEGRLTARWRTQHPNTEPAAKLLERILAERRKKWEAEQLAKFAKAGKPPPKGWQAKYAQPAAPDTSNLPGLPKGWCWATLEALADVVGGLTKDQKRANEPGVREVPYLRVANVQRGFLDLSEMKNIIASEQDVADLRLMPGDVLFTEGGDRDKLGRGWVWQGELLECVHQNHIFRARLFTPAMQPKFVSHHGNTFGREWFTKAGKQTTNLASINLGILRRFPVAVPPAAEQKLIVDDLDARLSQISEAELLVDHGLKRAARLRQSILKRAFEGKLVPQDPTDEPAEKLLERMASAKAKEAPAKSGTGRAERPRGRRADRTAAASSALPGRKRAHWNHLRNR